MEDHYFGAIKPRIMAFMEDLDRNLWRLGIPAKTRHNEVCPAQFEIAPVYEELNLATDHNMMTMEVLRNVAQEHGLICLLHEKPFDRVNGSGKHNNWSVVGPDGRNWLTPGDNPAENAEFMTMICALMQGIDTHAGLLRASIASPGNDHRLGANEAPPAIISIFLGEQLYDIIEQIEEGKRRDLKRGGSIQIGVSSLPELPRDDTDRNRTSPFAFTGNKFEFRAVGSSQNCSRANTVLNTIVADALDSICTHVENEIARGIAFHDALQAKLQQIVRDHKRILFNGDNYTQAWRDEAAARGLPNLATTPETLASLLTPETVTLFERDKVLSKRELQSRYNIQMEAYKTAFQVEGTCARTIVTTMVLPEALAYQQTVAASITAAEQLVGTDSCKRQRTLLAHLTRRIDTILEGVDALTAAVEAHHTDAIRDTMQHLRLAVDDLEGIMSRETWPLASYAEMMFIM